MVPDEDAIGPCSTLARRAGHVAGQVGFVWSTGVPTPLASGSPGYS
jgi:hypothetical protein